MTTIESKVTVDAPAAAVYQFLADLNNHQQLMPDNIVDWKSTPNEARFTIQNMAKLVLEITNRTQDLEILIAAIDNPPFPLQIKWELQEAGTQTEAIFTIAAELNMMMKMLAGGQLQKLTDYQTERLKELVKA